MIKIDNISEYGCVHGRFQPFHNEHMEYVLKAKERCKYLLIGITKYDCQKGRIKNEHRDALDANPFSYRERSVMIKDALIDYGIRREEFDITPFPIDNIESLGLFIPKDFVCYTTIREEWNIKKINILKKLGYCVDVLLENYSLNRISGTNIREMMQSGNQDWRQMVPAAVSRQIEEIYFNSESTEIRGS